MVWNSGGEAYLHMCDDNWNESIYLVDNIRPYVNSTCNCDAPPI